jgi:hypothetical protein
MKFNFNKESESAEIDVITSGKRNITCSDLFLFANTEVYHVEDFLREGHHKIQFKVAG